MPLIGSAAQFSGEPTYRRWRRTTFGDAAIHGPHAMSCDPWIAA